MPTRPGSRSLRTLGTLFVAPLLAALLVAWWLIGDVSERGGYMQLLPLPASATVAAVAGVLGILVAVVPVRELRTIRRTQPVGPEITRLAVSGVALGLFTGFVLRVLSSKTDGANIGGGMLMMYGPFVAVGVLFYAYRRWRSLGRP